MPTKLGLSLYSRAFPRYGQYRNRIHRAGRAKAKSTITSSPSKEKSTVKDVEIPPHSLLPNRMLLQALLVATVSSHSWLLRPALSVLSVLNRPRIAVLDVDRNLVLRQIVKRTFYSHFCAGENGAEVKGTIGRIKDMGFRGVILTYAKEIVVDASKNENAGGKDETGSKGVKSESPEHPDITEWSEGVLETVEMVNEGDILALKYDI